MNAHAYAVVGDPVGPTVTGADIEEAVQDLLKAWLPRYLAAVDDAHGLKRGSTPVPRGWGITGRDLEKLLSDQLPCVILLSGGVKATPRRSGGVGVTSATWNVALGVVFSAAWGLGARQRAQFYACAAELALVQRPLEALGQACQVDWIEERYDELGEFNSSRTYSASWCLFDVHCGEARWSAGGPPPQVEPPADPTVPFVPWVQVTDTDVTVDKQPLEEPEND